MMLMDTQNSGVHGWRTMFFTGAVLEHGVRILVNTGAIHNIIDNNFTRLVGLMEHHIITMILIGSSNKIAC